MNKKYIGCLTGRSGSGKNFVSDFIKKQYGWPVLTVSEILGKSRDQETSSGESVGSIMDRGGIVPVRTVIRHLEDEIRNSGENKLIINGFPRTIEQASFLETQNQFKIAVFYLKIKRNLCISRVLNSAYIGGRGIRADDRPDKIEIRQDIFEKDTLPAIKYLQGGGIVPVVVLDGKESAEINVSRIIKSLDNLA